MKNNANLEEIQELSNPHIIYALGFLWADGHLRITNGPEGRHAFNIRMGIVERDYNDLHHSFEYMGKSKKYFVNQKNYQPQIHWVLSDYRLGNWLDSMDYAEKSYVCPSKIVSAIPINLQHYWWRGFFDGDGCFWDKNNVPKRVFFGGQYSYKWKYILKFVKKLDCKFKIYTKIQKVGKVSILETSDQKSIMNFLHYIYKDCEDDKIGLNRKREKYLKYKNFKPNQYTNKEPYILYMKKSKKWRVVLNKGKKNILQRLFTSLKEAVKFRDNYFKINGLPSGKGNFKSSRKI